MTNAEMAILNLVGEMPRHGYEIEQTIENRGMREWTEISFSSIYYLLKKLEKNGLIESRLSPAEGRGPARRVYQITPEGKTALSAATQMAISEPQGSYPAFLLGLANLPVLSRAQTLKGLRTYLEGLSERHRHIRARAEMQRPLPDHVELMFDYSLKMLEAEMDWLELAIGKVTDKWEHWSGKNDKS